MKPLDRSSEKVTGVKQPRHCTGLFLCTPQVSFRMGGRNYLRRVKRFLFSQLFLRSLLIQWYIRETTCHT